MTPQKIKTDGTLDWVLHASRHAHILINRKFVAFIGLLDKNHNSNCLLPYSWTKNFSCINVFVCIFKEHSLHPNSNCGISWFCTPMPHCTLTYQILLLNIIFKCSNAFYCQIQVSWMIMNSPLTLTPNPKFWVVHQSFNWRHILSMPMDKSDHLASF